MNTDIRERVPVRNTVKRNMWFKKKKVCTYKREEKSN